LKLSYDGLHPHLDPPPRWGGEASACLPNSTTSALKLSYDGLHPHLDPPPSRGRKVSAFLLTLSGGQVLLLLTLAGGRGRTSGGRRTFGRLSRRRDIDSFHQGR
jgi:hypothetical protein